MLVYDQTVELVNVEVKLVLTLDLVVLLCEDLSLNLVFTDLVSGWEEENRSNNDYNGLALIVSCLQRFQQKNVECKPQVDEPTCSKDYRCIFVIVGEVLQVHVAKVYSTKDMNNYDKPLEALLIDKVSDNGDHQLVGGHQGLKVSIESREGICVVRT